jgi:hypothetical protein
MNKIVTEYQYFGCINLHSVLFKNTNVFFDKFEHFQKMSFRNRCIVAGSNGLINLTVPVVGGRNTKQLMKDVKINYMENWQQQHWRTIVSCYARSPFFEFYQDELEILLKKQYTYLCDLNAQTFTWINKQLRNNYTVSATDSYIKNYPPDTEDARNRWLPNNYARNNHIKSQQVFETKNGFHPNLSILDLLFCEGANSKNLLINI